MNAKERRKQKRIKTRKLEEQRKQVVADFNRRRVPFLDTGIVVEEVEIANHLDYQKHPEFYTKIFQDPLKDFDDELFAPKKKKKHVFQFKPADNEAYFREKTR